MSAQASAGQSPPAPHGCPLLVVIDPVARTMDGESVRIAKDVLRAGAPSLKFCFPDSTGELAKIIEHRGRRRPVVIGDDTALLRTVRLLHREGALAEAALSLVPVGQRAALSLARSLGVPLSAVAAARAALDGAERTFDALVDDSGGIVVGALRIPGVSGAPAVAPPEHSGWLERGARTLVRALTAPLPGVSGGGHRLRVEADGVVLADLDRPVREVSVRSPAGGMAEVVVRGTDPAFDDEGPLPVRAQAVTVSGRDFRYRADEAAGGPVRRRTWTVRENAWRLTLPTTAAG
ncbi:diacylglycerol kinase [Streptomyces sp. ICBB 8177]|nr:diacylglycerol kinase [Streptomyces sp. ICBB 8177]